MLPGEVLEQSDGTAWMAKFCLNMLEMALLLANRNPVYEDVAIKFFEHFALIAAAMEQAVGRAGRIFLRSACARRTAPRSRCGRARWWGFCQSSPPWSSTRRYGSDCRCFANGRAGTSSTNWAAELSLLPPSDDRPRLISLVEKSRFQRILARMLDETEFLSPYGLRSLSRYHQEHPLVLDFDGHISLGSTTNRENLAPASSAATPTGAGRSGFR